MTDYKNIRGKKIKFFTSDLGNTEAEGQIYYINESPGSVDSAGSFKTAVGLAAWSSGGGNITKHYAGAGAGTQTAGLVFGGNDGSSDLANTTEYNGTGFVAGGDLTTARYTLGGGGTQTAALAFGGEPPNSGVNHSEEYNGTSWTEGNNLNNNRRATSGAGPQTAATCVGGTDGTVRAFQEHYDGTSWTEVADLNTAKRNTTTVGNSSSALNFAGYNPGASKLGNTELWNGTSWTEVADLNTTRFGASGTGSTSAAAHAFGGNVPGATANTELWDGSSWTETANITTARGYGSGFGSTTAGALSTGYSTVYHSATEEFNQSATVFTGNAWASGGNMNQARYYMQGAGAAPQDAALGAGGYGPGTFESWGATEEYNGTSWSEVNDLPREMGRLFGAGTQTAALFGGGYAHPNTNYNEVFEYNGTNWSEGGDLNTTRGMGANFGTQTAALFGGGGNFGGSSSVEAEVEEYNGTSWTEVTNLPNATRNNASFGTQTAGVVTQGKISPNGAWPGTNTNVTFEYDGTNWTSAAAGLVTGPAGEGVGTQTDGGTCGNNGGIYQRYDGTSWITDARTASNGGSRGTSGTAAAAIAFAGFDDPTVLNATEEFTTGSTALNLKTITDS